MKHKNRFGVAGVIAVGLMLFASPTHASTPTFEISADGLQLLGVETFQDSYHVNVKLVGEYEQRNMHIEGKCLTKTDHECAAVRHAHVNLTLHEEAQFIGESFLPWRALGLRGDFCIEWVQVYGHNYHFKNDVDGDVCSKTPPKKVPGELMPPTPGVVDTAAG